ncbi:MAG: acetyl-CoA carboxylase biotin carboxyl carrier protein subunit [Eubacterium sp.]|nr:acetyl-CoA carboxylase biotin carboxyl carrier protein subunit [Eubacterium sp.]
METYLIRVNGVTYEVEVEKKAGAQPVQAQSAQPAQPAAAAPAAAAAAAPAPQAPAAGGTEVTCGTAGKVWKLSAQPGAVLKAGDPILILEAMKMEIPVVAPEDGTLDAILVSEGQEVASGQAVAVLR